MDKNTIIFNGEKADTFKETSNNRIISLLGRGKKKEYKDNPPVAAIVNGELMSLQDTIPENAEIETVPLFSTMGRRVYRKTLCFLLSYASATLFPERSLVIGHSLGDGYYFSYRGKEKPDIKALKAKMTEAIERDLPIEYKTLTSDEAMEYVKKHGLKETEKLLESRNDGSYIFQCLDGCMEMYYEPMLPSTRFLAIWDLIEYEDGLLLRYPQSRNDKELMPFVDNKNLFAIFRENKKYAEILKIESLGALNENLIKGNINDTILLSELLQRRRFMEIAKFIKDKKSIKLVFISGPSSSGKTTSALKLANELKINGYVPIKISLDDYYLPLDKVPRDKDGDYDFESINALNLPLFRKQVNALINGEGVRLSKYSIKKREHTFDDHETKLGKDDILIIEGIHGLNPNLIPDVDDKYVYRIYISALTQLNLDSRSRISTTDNRILRRLIRDNRTRGLSAVDTLLRWPSVENGEKNNIFPYQDFADAMVNSSLEYEIGVLSVYAIPLLRSVKKETGAPYTTARRLLKFLELVYPIPDEAVPSDSLLREFIGGSIYDVS